MSDIVSAEKRSQMMAGIRGKDSKPELLIRTALHARGFRYKLHDRTLPGKPDMSFPKYNAVILIHGCFWHHHDCELFRWPRNNAEFWQKKITANVTRDKKQRLALSQEGLRVLTVWECAIRRKKERNSGVVIDRIVHWLIGSDSSLDITERNLYGG